MISWWSRPAPAVATWGDIAWKWHHECGGINGILGPPADYDETDFGFLRKGYFLNGVIDWYPHDRSMVAHHYHSSARPC